MNTIQSEWEKFVAEAIAPDANPMQVSELKLAFYAGAWAMMGMQHKIVQEGYSEAAGVAVMGGVYEEMKNYFEENK